MIVWRDTKTRMLVFPTPFPFFNLSVSFIAPVSDTGWAGVTENGGIRNYALDQKLGSETRIRNYRKLPETKKLQETTN